MPRTHITISKSNLPNEYYGISYNSLYSPSSIAGRLSVLYRCGVKMYGYYSCKLIDFKRGKILATVRETKTFTPKIKISLREQPNDPRELESLIKLAGK